MIFTPKLYRWDQNSLGVTCLWKQHFFGAI
ncbi:hypothetical protein LINPERPRIM_LOCUS26307 [Linum perenne]